MLLIKTADNFLKAQNVAYKTADNLLKAQNIA